MLPQELIRHIASIEESWKKDRLNFSKNQMVSNNKTLYLNLNFACTLVDCRYKIYILGNTNN